MDLLRSEQKQITKGSNILTLLLVGLKVISHTEYIRGICIPVVRSQEKALHTLKIYHQQSCVKLKLIDFNQTNAIGCRPQVTQPWIIVALFSQPLFPGRFIQRFITSVTQRGQSFVRYYFANR